MFEKLTQEAFDNMLLCKDDYNSIEDYSIDTELVFPELVESIVFNNCAFNKPIKNVEFYNVTFCNVDISKFSNCVFTLCKFYRCVFNAGYCFCDCDISDTSLKLCNLNGSVFEKCTISDTYFWCSDLRLAGFSNTSVSCVTFISCDTIDCHSLNSNLVFPQHVPSDGSFIAWKKAKAVDEAVIIKLRIPEDAKRFCVNNKCRANKVEVLGFETLDGEKLPDDMTVHSFYDSRFKYHTGLIEVYNFNDDQQVECGRGIHFFLSRDDAVNYVF